MPPDPRNAETAARYIDLYNTDIGRFVPECYTPDCRVLAMGGGVIDGPAAFLQVERTVLAAAPRRQMRLDHLHAIGDSVTIEVTLLNPDQGTDWARPFVAVLTLRDGLIAVDRSYADWSDWPGLGSLLDTTAPPAVNHVTSTRVVADSAQARANLAVAERYVSLYNSDPERFVRECYHADYRVGAMGIGWYDGIDKFVAIEKKVLAAAPQRRMRADYLHAGDAVVVVEAAVVDPSRGADWEIPFCAVLEIRGDRIAVDRTYADFRAWPGLEVGT